jgi:hypothetical protein
MLGNKGYVLAVVADFLKLPIHFLVGDVILKGGWYGFFVKVKMKDLTPIILPALSG